MRKYNLKAIHNAPIELLFSCRAVEDQCESTIWKQFTTMCFCEKSRMSLLKTNAKVQFESNSQLIVSGKTVVVRCWRPMRKYNLKAIHNRIMEQQVYQSAVEDQCESTIWKQFTTNMSTLRQLFQLLKTNAKVQFESNSQLINWNSGWLISCWRPMRKYNLKAIHNLASGETFTVDAVEDQCESTIWKQFTTCFSVHDYCLLLLKTNAKVQFESNSQPNSHSIERIMAVEDQCESTIWKQFTTLFLAYPQLQMLLKTNAKVQFESNSQRS